MKAQVSPSSRKGPRPDRTRIEAARIDTPIGVFEVYARAGVVVAAGFEGRGVGRIIARRFPNAETTTARRTARFLVLLRRYFDGDLLALDRIEVDPGGTEFQRRVWAALRRIPTGRTLSYGRLARSLGVPSATRAVGAANGSNPIPVVIPCHRVIGSGGSLTGYGGGLGRKRWLLRHEGALPEEE